MKQILLINKPVHYTSNDTIRIIKKISKQKKVGHAGTLDPLAQGLLIICIGRQNTKHIQDFMNLPKTYQATINLTALSATDDAEGPLTPLENLTIPTLEHVENVLKKFIGQQLQTPPIFSAIKINGIPCYKRARKQQEVKLEPRAITIHAITLIKYEWPEISIEVICSKGTYIRSLARDIGLSLQTGGYLSGLIRTQIGEFDLKKAFCIKNLTELKEHHFLSIP